jgi:uncharacterized membrane protein
MFQTDTASLGKGKFWANVNKSFGFIGPARAFWLSSLIMSIHAQKHIEAAFEGWYFFLIFKQLRFIRFVVIRSRIKHSRVLLDFLLYLISFLTVSLLSLSAVVSVSIFNPVMRESASPNQNFSFYSL